MCSLQSRAFLWSARYLHTKDGFRFISTGRSCREIVFEMFTKEDGKHKAFRLYFFRTNVRPRVLDWPRTNRSTAVRTAAQRTGVSLGNRADTNGLSNYRCSGD